MAINRLGELSMFKTIETNTTFEIVEKKSKFIANLIYVIVLNELTKFISKKLRIRKNLRY